MEHVVFHVEVADSTGHSVVEMTQPQLVKRVQAEQGTWVFVNDQLVNANELADMNIEADSSIRLMPGLVGGLMQILT